MMYDSVNQSNPPTPNKDNFFYYSSLTDEEKAMYDSGDIEIDNLDAEIMLLKIRIRSIALQQPYNVSILIAAVNCLNAAIRTSAKVLNRIKPQEMNFRRIIQNMFRNAPASLIETIANAPEPGPA